MVKFKAINLPTEANTYSAPRRNYLFRVGEWQNVEIEEDIAFFKKHKNFEKKSIVRTSSTKKKSKKKK